MTPSSGLPGGIGRTRSCESGGWISSCLRRNSLRSIFPWRTIRPPPTDILPEAREAGREIVLFVPDVESKWPLYPSVLAEYFAKDRPHAELLLYLPEDLSKPEHLRSLEEALSQYEDRDSYVTLQTGTTLDERLLFQCADYYVTTRSRPTVARTCLADLYQAKILYGTDTQLFPERLGECRKGGV